MSAATDDYPEDFTPWADVASLIRFLTAEGYVKSRKGQPVVLLDGGRDWLLCNIAVNVNQIAALLREDVQATGETAA